jgi:predicted benzoate:H+ symporter BenE
MTPVDVQELRTLLYMFAICLAGIFLYLAVKRFEPNRPLATLLTILILGVTAAAILNRLLP